MNPVRLSLFVYGTLKRGQSNHERFCLGLLSAQEANVRGRLYELPYGFPALVVPEADVRATGSTNYLSDAKIPAYEENIPREGLPGPTVYGELFYFDDPEKRLPVLDALEGFRPGETGFYKRILVPATLMELGTLILAWTYAIESATGVHLPDGRWPTV